jgi:hypothetical protein
MQEANDASSLEVDREANSVILKDERGQSSEFHFDRVYDQDALQEEIFMDAVTPIVDQVSRGMSCAVCGPNVKYRVACPPACHSFFLSALLSARGDHMSR